MRTAVRICQQLAADFERFGRLQMGRWRPICNTNQSSRCAPATKPQHVRLLLKPSWIAGPAPFARWLGVWPHVLRLISSASGGVKSDAGVAFATLISLCAVLSLLNPSTCAGPVSLLPPGRRLRADRQMIAQTERLLADD